MTCYIMKSTHIVTMILACLVLSGAWVKLGNAAGECGKTTIPVAAASMSPCLGAAGNLKTKVSPPCCSKVAALISTAPRCLCAVILSPLASQAGLKPAIAVTIPKRCNIRNRPVGKKCGRYIVP